MDVNVLSRTIHKGRKVQATSVSLDGRVDRWCIHTMEYSSAMRRNEVLILVAIWVHLIFKHRVK